MNITQIKMNFLGALESDFKLLNHAFCSTFAHEVSNIMVEEYKNVVDRFYGEYTPMYYHRHPGLGRTYKKYYTNSHGSVYYGGVEITSENMFTDYHDSPQDVLNSFLNGFHGRPSAGVFGSVLPFKHMLTFKDLLLGSVGSSSSKPFSAGLSAARSQGYQLIRVL